MNHQDRKADVLASLTAEMVLRHFAVDYRQSGGELRFQTCPACGPRTRADSVAANRKSGCWIDHAHGCHGDLFSMVAGFAGIDVKVEFPAVIEQAAAVAGMRAVDVSSVQRAQRVSECERTRAMRLATSEHPARTHLALARQRATAYWRGLYPRHASGEQYLASRGLAGLLGRGDLVRFTAGGDVSVPLHDLTDSAVMNVITRRRCLVGTTSKIRGLAGCPTLGTFGQVSRLDATAGHVWLVEGLFDYLSGVQLFEPDGNLVLGAHGAGNIPKIVGALASRLARRHRAIVYVAHEDAAGAHAVERAVVIAVAAGIPFDPEVDLFNLGGAKDLNDALRAEAGDVREYF